MYLLAPLLKTKTMKRFFSLLTTAVIITSCSGEVESELNHPPMRHTNLQNIEVRPGSSRSLDLDGDGTKDFFFYTQLVGDPVLKRDRLQFYAGSTIKTNLLNDANDESPVLPQGAQVMLNHPGYTWYEISAIVLTEKITPLAPPTFWQGRWSNASHQYLPVQINKGGKLYMGWIELSMDKTAEKLVLHRAAISKEPARMVRAGY